MTLTPATKHKNEYTSSIHMVTTIKLKEQTKRRLNELKPEEETYDKLISRLIDMRTKKDLAERLKEGYHSKTDEQFKEFKEWDSIE